MQVILWDELIGLVRLQVLFVMSLAKRKIEIAQIGGPVNGEVTVRLLCGPGQAG